ncbi:hypothetical protein TNCV_109351 [Trichonephila clavipes]|nr:hypothetical protein TNCV_109351 [Trichonephila clavipes]
MSFHSVVHIRRSSHQASGKWHVTYGVPVPERDVPPHQNFRNKGRINDFTKLKFKDIIKMGRTILLERRQNESVGRRNSRTTFLRSDWPWPFARREVGVEMELGRSENKRPEQGDLELKFKDLMQK